MSDKTKLSQQLECLYRQQTGKMLAYLISLVGDIGVAEEIWQDTFEKALSRWGSSQPEHPKAWLATVARNSAVDYLRHRKISLEKLRTLQALAKANDSSLDIEHHQFPDEQLKLIFTCCHPAIAFDNQVALTLYSICGLTTDEIAQSLLLSRSTLEQRMTRAKRKVKQANISYSIPSDKEIPARLDAVLKVFYLVFSTGFNDERNPSASKVDLCKVSISMMELLVSLLPEANEAKGLQALMLFIYARRSGRLDANGNLVVLEKQNRELWDWKLIEDADHILTKALKNKNVGSYQIQAAIAGVHSTTRTAESTDWLHVEGLYKLLVQLEPSPVIRLNSAVATAFARGYEQGLYLLNRLEESGELKNYSPLYAAKAELLRRMKQQPESNNYYLKAISCSHSKKEQEYFRSCMSNHN